ncbi:hypothetical protein EWM64_g7249 [Hericium alpestre]|uniref:Protein kinase domain-containing protein n=1 Tax=Hericium alpestre TaxID=135208 RepID=A0A4Y9ZSH6_9AGAM|nr:hypothetical protein EWM64_g7249 [Hericium alpestre]
MYDLSDHSIQSPALARNPKDKLPDRVKECRLKKDNANLLDTDIPIAQYINCDSSKEFQFVLDVQILPAATVQPVVVPQSCYAVYMPHGRGAQCRPFNLPEEAKVEDLQAAICGHREFKRALEGEDVRLYKCGDISTGPLTAFDPAREWLQGHINNQEIFMVPTNRLAEYFPNGPAPENQKKVDVIVATGSILEGFDLLRNLPGTAGYASQVSKERQSRIDKIGQLPSPSEGIKTEKGIKKFMNEDNLIHCHRPAENYGPPIALFNHALARLKHSLDHLDQLEDPSYLTLEQCHELIVEASVLYDSEDSRKKALRPILNRLLGDGGRWEATLEGRARIPDAIWGDIAQLIFEMKNEDGLGGNATLQGTIVFTKVLAQEKYAKYVERSHCPVILVGMMGTRLEISSAIFTDGVYVDKLVSQELFIDAWQSETVLRLGRIFKALSHAMTALTSYYDNLQADADCTYLYPCPLSAVEGLHIPKLKYLGKLSRQGEIIAICRNTVGSEEDLGSRTERRYALYRATMQGDDPADKMDVVVKFAVSYNEKAHRLLADKGLAPTLHFHAPLVGGMHMVVMDYIHGSRPPQKQQDYEDVEKAISLLHNEDMVFGDIRKPNIIAKPNGGAMLIDFDWVGKHQVSKYPASWSIDDTRLDAGVTRRGLMDKKHDTILLEGLKKSFGFT